MRRPHWRKMTWAILIWSILMAVWIISAIASANPARSCVRYAAGNVHTCEAFSTAGTGIAVVVLVILWAFVFGILSLIWLMTKPRTRLCPVCGEKVRKGLTVCPSCHHDFAAAAAAGQALPS